ncbi:unnamed protein product [Somion occarium]|uniref:BTB domain-containing protein n=1 Tax=Somion occarium TaxID=3059160 RepID=A0ABP1DKC2_9APHY
MKSLTIKIPPAPISSSDATPLGTPDPGLWHRKTQNPVVIRAGPTLFRVDATCLCRESAVFSGFMRQLPRVSSAGLCPWIEVSDTAEDVRNLLGFLYDDQHVPKDVDEVLSALRMCARYEMGGWTLVHERLYDFLMLIYPSTLEDLDHLQVQQIFYPQIQRHYWLNSDVCFRLLNALANIRNEIDDYTQVDDLWFGLLLCCATRPFEDIDQGIVDLDGNWWELDPELREFILHKARPSLDYIARKMTYGFIWNIKYHPLYLDTHRLRGTTSSGIRKKWPKRVSKAHLAKQCQRFRGDLKGEVDMFRDAHTGYVNPFWIPLTFRAGKLLECVTCCRECRETWMTYIEEGRTRGWQEVLSLFRACNTMEE